MFTNAEDDPMVPQAPFAPICDSHEPLYNVPMKYVGPTQVTAPGLRVNNPTTYQCVVASCGRLFDPSAGYFSIPDRSDPARTTMRCGKHDQWKAIISVSNDREWIRLGCLQCEVADDPTRWR